MTNHRFSEQSVSRWNAEWATCDADDEEPSEDERAELEVEYCCVKGEEFDALYAHRACEQAQQATDAAPLLDDGDGSLF